MPPNFEEAYGRRARIVVQFYKLDEDSPLLSTGSQRGPQGQQFHGCSLSTKYPTIEFFSYEIATPGP